MHQDSNSTVVVLDGLIFWDGRSQFVQ